MLSKLSFSLSLCRCTGAMECLTQPITCRVPVLFLYFPSHSPSIIYHLLVCCFCIIHPIHPTLTHLSSAGVLFLYYPSHSPHPLKPCCPFPGSIPAKRTLIEWSHTGHVSDSRTLIDRGESHGARVRFPSTNLLHTTRTGTHDINSKENALSQNQSSPLYEVLHRPRSHTGPLPRPLVFRPYSVETPLPLLPSPVLPSPVLTSPLLPSPHIAHRQHSTDTHTYTLSSPPLTLTDRHTDTHRQTDRHTDIHSLLLSPHTHSQLRVGYQCCFFIFHRIHPLSSIICWCVVSVLSIPFTLP